MDPSYRCDRRRPVTCPYVVYPVSCRHFQPLLSNWVSRVFVSCTVLPRKRAIFVFVISELSTSISLRAHSACKCVNVINITTTVSSPQHPRPPFLAVIRPSGVQRFRLRQQRSWPICGDTLGWIPYYIHQLPIPDHAASSTRTHPQVGKQVQDTSHPDSHPPLPDVRCSPWDQT